MKPITSNQIIIAINMSITDNDGACSLK